MDYPYRSGGQAWPVNENRGQNRPKIAATPWRDYDATHAQAQMLLIEKVDA
jgi:hypothetical protein